MSSYFFTNKNVKYFLLTAQAADGDGTVEAHNFGWLKVF